MEEKSRRDSVVRDSNGIVVYGTKNTPGYALTGQPEDFGLTQRKNTQLYRIPAVAYLYLISRD